MTTPKEQLFTAMVINKMTGQILFARPGLDEKELTELIMSQGVYARHESVKIIETLKVTKVLRFPSLGHQGVNFKLTLTGWERS